ncbi:MAG TPA: FeoA family protein [Jatrophihabitans sp.]|nr:FeoA family protein [Jatrophihabitans sp.]
MPRDCQPSGLHAASLGRTLRITGVDIAGRERVRLAQFGLRPGALVTVLGRTAGGGKLVGIGTSRIALDRVTAGRLAVQVA